MIPDDYASMIVAELLSDLPANRQEEVLSAIVGAIEAWAETVADAVLSD